MESAMNCIKKEELNAMEEDKKTPIFITKM